jgi:hypothetical protein
VEAKSRWVEFYDDWGRDMGARGHLKGAWSKLRGYCARLSLILHLLRWACGEAEPGAVDEISVQGAITLTTYLASHAERIHFLMSSSQGAANGPDNDNLLDAIGRVVSKHGTWQGTATELMTQLHV